MDDDDDDRGINVLAFTGNKAFDSFILACESIQRSQKNKQTNGHG